MYELFLSHKDQFVCESFSQSLMYCCLTANCACLYDVSPALDFLFHLALVSISSLYLTNWQLIALVRVGLENLLLVKKCAGG